MVSEDIYDLSKISLAELLLIWRLREPSPTRRRFGRSDRFFSQAEAAARLGFELTDYADLEKRS
jgi:hypothetical protein